MKFHPHNYQRDTIRFCLENPHAAIFADPGLGKTAIILSVLKCLTTCRENVSFLLVAPLRVIYSVWPKEIKKWNFDLTYHNLHADPTRRAANIVAINPESLEKGLELYEAGAPWPFLGVCVDESTRLKKWTGKRFRALKKRLAMFRRRYILTGTPIPNSLLDIFAQQYIVDMGKSLGDKITHFQAKYFYRPAIGGPYNYKILPHDGAPDFVFDRIKDTTVRIDAETYLDLPDLIVNDVPVDLPTKALRTYKEVERDLFTQIDGREVNIASAASSYNACRQIANGVLFEQIDPDTPIPANRKSFDVHPAKVDAVKDLIADLWGKPVLVAYHFRHDLKALLAAFPDTPYIGGGVSAKQTDRIIAKWNAGRIPILFGHPAAMSHGLNMQSGGNDIIWFSLTDNLEHYDQFNRRIYRQGVTGQVRIHRIIANETVDRALIGLLDKKHKGQKALLNALRNYRRNQASGA